MKYFLDALLVSLKIVVVLCIITYISLFAFEGSVSWANIKNYTFFNFFYGIPLSFANGFLADGLSKILPWDKKPKTRAWIGFALTIIISMGVLYILNFILWTLIWGKDSASFFDGSYSFDYSIALIITVVISSIIHAAGFFKWAQEERVISEKLRKEKIASELNALKAHIDPHFLFNSFNILSGLIEEDPKKAQKVLGELSGIYRYILENRTEDTNTIAAELGFAKKYLGLQQARFEDSIFLNIDIPEVVMSQKIPSLTLQLLLENAIKHNACSKERPLEISITKADNHLIVTNNKRIRINLEESNGMGLQNIEDRYVLLNKGSITILDNEDSFTIKLPIIS